MKASFVDIDGKRCRFHLPVRADRPDTRKALREIFQRIQDNPRKTLGTLVQLRMVEDERGRISLELDGALVGKDVFSAVQTALKADRG